MKLTYWSLINATKTNGEFKVDECKGDGIKMKCWRRNRKKTRHVYRKNREKTRIYRIHKTSRYEYKTKKEEKESRGNKRNIRNKDEDDGSIGSISDHLVPKRKRKTGKKKNATWRWSKRSSKESRHETDTISERQVKRMDIQGRGKLGRQTMRWMDFIK